jgi:hypothetical protein
MNPNGEPGERSRYSDRLRDVRARVGVRIPGGVRFLTSPPSKHVLGPTEPLGELSPGVKWPGREADQSPPTIFAVSYMLLYTSTSHTSS